MAELGDKERLGAAALIATEPSLDRRRAAAADCTACSLYANATQTVFGEGRAPDEETRHPETQRFIADLKKLAELLGAR